MPIGKTPVIFQESQLAHRLLDGLKGLEIGPAAHNPFGLQTKNVGLSPEHDPIDHEFFRQSQLDHCGDVAPIHIAADAAKIPVADGSTDFVLHSHVWEHLQEPLAALEEWVRVTKSGGYIFVIVPKREAAESDKGRPVTRLASLAETYERFRRMAGQTKPPGSSRGHHTVFSLALLQEIGVWFNQSHFRSQLEEVASQETDDKVGNGHTIVWRVHKTGLLGTGGRRLLALLNHKSKPKTVAHR
ncbi:MAG: methyltransferase domain-containing protein [Chthoniobacterales bacterium]